MKAFPLAIAALVPLVALAQSPARVPTPAPPPAAPVTSAPSMAQSVDSGTADRNIFKPRTPSSSASMPSQAPGLAQVAKAPPAPVVDSTKPNKVKEKGKRIGEINGVAIYRLDEQYYFDKPAEPAKN